MVSQEQVVALIHECLENSDKFLVEIVIQPTNRILVYIDSDTSVTISDCQNLSRQIEQRLDRNKEDFDLTVSSSGIDRPLKLTRQYAKNKGRKINVITNTNEIIKGILRRADESEIELEHPVVNRKKSGAGRSLPQQRENTIISFGDIKEAKIEAEF